MANTKSPTIYEVTFAGEYFANVKGGNELRPYEVTVKLSDEHKVAGFLSVFKNLVAPKMMRAKYPDFADGLYTHRIVSVVDIEDPEAIPHDPQLMNLSQLAAFIQHNNLPIEIGLYRDEDELRQGVIDCLQDREAFLQHQEKRKEVRGNELELTNSLASLNPELATGLSTDNLTAVNQTKIPSTEDITLPPQSPPASDNTDEFNESILNQKGDEDDLGI